MTGKRILAFALAIIMLLSISGFGYYRSVRAQEKEEQRNEQITEAYNTLLNLLETEDYDGAASQAEACLALLNPEEEGELYRDVVLKLACVEALQGEKESSLAHCEEILKADSDYSEALLLSSGLYSDLGNDEKGEEVLRRYIDLTGDKSYCYRLGLSAVQKEDYEGAITDLSEYISGSLCLNDSEAVDDAFYYRGISNMALEEYEAAAEDFERCVRGGVEYEDSLFNAGLCRLLNNEPVRAMALFNRCVSEGINAEKSAEYMELSNELLTESINLTEESTND